jgi:DeoR/GlpR family transcriptional regulator of sugar metabolism
MLQAERAEKILQFINEKGFAKTTELIELCQVSKPTIIRDLQLLEQRGAIIRTHGGAKSLKKGTNFEPKQSIKEQFAYESKKQIARMAKQYIFPGETILLDSGTTTLMLAEELKDMENITVITNDIKVAMVLAENDGIELVVLGGQKRKGVYSLIGPITEMMIDQFHVDKVFLSADAIHIDKGITNANIEESSVKKAFINICKERFLLVDSNKFNSISFVKIADIDEVQTIITDEGILRSSDLESWKKLSVELISAGKEEGGI